MRITTLVVAALSALALGVGAVSASNAPVRWSFDVSFDEDASDANGVPTWTGTATGPGAGTIAVKLLPPFGELRGEALHIELEVVVTAGSRSSTVRLSGVFNEVTTRGVLNGVVSSGWLAGAQAHQEAARFDPASPARLTGTLRLMPGSAG